MELIELTSENIAEYLTDCIEVQKFLIAGDKPIDAAQFSATAAAPHNFFVGVVDDGRLVGMGVVNKIVHPVRTVGYVDNIVVHPDARGKGYFTVIMDSLEAKAKEWGAARIQLTCSREAVQPLYDKRGYLEKQTKYYQKQL